MLTKLIEFYKYTQHIYSWLDLLTKTTRITKKDIHIPDEIPKEEIFLYLCSSLSSDRKIIVSSKEDIKCVPYKTEGIVVYKNIDINVLDRDDAVLELQYNKINNYISSSIIAGNNNDISNVEIK